MAYVAGVWTAAYTFKDNNGNVGMCSVNYPAAMTAAQVETSATSLATDLQAISTAALVGYTIGKYFVNDAPIVPPVDSEVERKLFFNLSTALHQNVSSIEVPSPTFLIEIPDTDIVNQGHALVVALVQELTAGVATPGNGPVTYYGADITQATGAVITHRHRKPRK